MRRFQCPEKRSLPKLHRSTPFPPRPRSSVLCDDCDPDRSCLFLAIWSTSAVRAGLGIGLDEEEAAVIARADAALAARGDPQAIDAARARGASMGIDEAIMVGRDAAELVGAR